METTASDFTPGEPPHVHHMDPVTAYHSAKLGMWLFLATEILLFGGLFCAFAIYRYLYLPEFKAGAEELNVWLGTTNTLVLIVSSFFAAIALDAAQHGDNKKVVKYLTVTVTCGFLFLVIKFIEYKAKYHHGLFPLELFGDKGVVALNPYFNSAEFNAKYKSFFGLYYCMTMLHALHVIAGMAVLGWVRGLAKRERFSKRYYTPVEIGALYWHLVDVIWIYLFSLLYLI